VLFFAFMLNLNLAFYSLEKKHFHIAPKLLKKDVATMES